MSSGGKTERQEHCDPVNPGSVFNRGSHSAGTGLIPLKDSPTGFALADHYP